MRRSRDGPRIDSASLLHFLATIPILGQPPSVNVKSIERDEALASTREYWYLRWRDTNAGSYT